MDEYTQLTIRGDAFFLSSSSTIVTSRRHVLSKTFGDVTPDSLVQLLDSPTVSRDPTSVDGYSLITAEVWGYGVSDVVKIASRLNASNTRVVALDEYIACLRQNAKDLRVQGHPVSSGLSTF